MSPPDLYLCRPGREKTAAAELQDAGVRVTARGPGLVQGEGRPDIPGGPAFPWFALHEAGEFAAGSVNALAAALADALLEEIRGERIDGPWPCLVTAGPGTAGLGRRAAAVRGALLERLRRRVARVARLADDRPPPGGGPATGWFVHLETFDRAWAARGGWSGGQRRMADDPAAPSRSYLKVEEAYGVLGREPAAGETVCDLGAAPGGWSYSAARRGARVVAVDNGPLKGGALGHPHVDHRRADAFGFRPDPGQVYDWLFCDLVEEPHHVLRDLLEPWLDGGWCRRFVVILKFGRTDPAALLREVRAPGGPVLRRAPDLRVRHLHHDRDEVTLVGTVTGPDARRRTP